MSNLKEIFKKIRTPILFLLGFSLLYLLWQIMELPDKESLTLIAQKYFERYGLVVVFVSALIEALLLAGLYYPGGLVILLGVIFTGPDPLKVTLIVFLVTLGMFSSYLINFFLGKYGWYQLFTALGLEEQIKKGQEKLSQHGTTAILLANWHPNFGAITATAAGILNFPLRKFIIISFFSSLAWNIFWGTVAYFFGDIAFSVIGFRFILLVAAIWIGIIVFSNKRINS